MRLGIISDTHEDRMNALPHIMRRFKEMGVEIILHAGDIDEKHVNSEIFDGLPVYCALTDEQTKICETEMYKVHKEGIPFCFPPAQWNFTQPDKRIIDLLVEAEKLRVYVGHKRSFEFLMGDESKLLEKLYAIRKDNDGVRFLFSGHTHHQILMENRLITFINPGAVSDSMGIAGGYEYAFIDTSADKIVFSRISASVSSAPQLKLGVVSDSLNISRKDIKFWQKLAEVFRNEGVTDIIHCGNLDLTDVGCLELREFQVYFNLIGDESRSGENNWQAIDKEKRIIDIKGYKFFVQWDLGADFLHKSERDMHYYALEILRHNRIDFVLFGFTHHAFFEEGENLIFLNPGDIIQSRDYAIIELPRYEITFGRIPYDPLPSLR